MDTTRPLDGKGRWLRSAPFATIGLIGLVIAAMSTPTRPGAVWLAAGGAVLLLFVLTLLPWQRWPAGWHAVPAFGFFGLAVLLEYAAGGDLYFLAAMPIIWLALYHTRRLMLVGLGLMAATLFLPLLVAPASFPERSWGTSVLAFALACLGGLIGQYLMNRARTTAAEAEAASRQARADRDLLNAYLDTAACLMVVLDHTGRVTLFNRYCEQVTGYHAAQVLGRRLWELPAVPPRARALYDAVLAGDWPASAEDDLPTRGGARRRVRWSATGLHDEHGRLSHVVATGLDLTEQRATERLFADVLAAATEQIIYAVEPTGTFTVFNAGAERLLGYSADELIGVAQADILYEPTELAELMAETGIRDLEALAAQPEPLQPGTRELTLVAKDGTRIPVALSFSEMRQGGEVSGYVVVASDITAERRSAEAMVEALARERAAADQLRELDQAKSDFVATVSHDLRTPLTSIVGNAELLLDGEAGELTAQQQRLLEAVDRNARRLNRLVGDLLMLSRIEAGTLRMAARPVALSQVVTGAMEALTAQLAGDVRVEVRLPAEPLLVMGDLELLERVAINLVGNALKFTPPGGRVEIAVAASADRVRWWIADTGIGIPEDELPHIFDRFYRTSRSQRRQRPGTGLGLSIAKSIIEQHHGTIAARVNQSGGTTFDIDLPRLASTAEASAKGSV